MVVFFIILLIFFIPIPLIIKIHYSENLYYIKFFNFTILNSNTKIANKINPSSNKKKKKYFLSKIFQTNNKKKLSISNLYIRISNNRFKPKIMLKCHLNFSLEDAAMTAISYGLLNNIQVLLLLSLEKVFRIKNNVFSINPQFIGKNLLIFTVSSIIYFNIAQIIYILFLIYKSLEKVEEVYPS